MNVILNEQKLCDNHENVNLQNMMNIDEECKDDQLDNDWIIIDGDGQQYDVRRCMRYYDVVENIKTDEQRAEAVKILSE